MGSLLHTWRYWNQIFRLGNPGEEKINVIFDFQVVEFLKYLFIYAFFLNGHRIGSSQVEISAIVSHLHLAIRSSSK